MKTLIKTGLAVVALSLCLNANALAGKFEDGLSAHERGDYAMAYRLFLPFAKQGDAKAQYSLALMYDNGQGVPQDYVEAVKWYRKAADQGVADAQNNLALMYGNGQGVPQDYAEAMKWYRKAAEQGNASAQSNLGVMYGIGKGVPQDYVQAHKWLNLASAFALKEKAGEGAAKGRDLISAKMTPEQIAEAQKLAREWKPTSSTSGK